MGLSLTQVGIGMLIFVTVFAGLGIVFGDFINTYNLNPDDTYYNDDTTDTSRIGRIFNLSVDLQDRFDDTDADQSNLDASVVGGLNSIKIFSNAVDYSVAIVNIISLAIGVPTWLVTSFIAGIVLVVVLSILAAFLGRTQLT